MRRRNLLLLLMTLGVAFACPAPAADRAIAWEGKGADGKTIRFDPQKLPRPAILLFWATWCPYCEALMPSLQRVLDAAGPAQLDVYAIDIKDDGDPAATLRERRQTFTLVREGDAIAASYGVKGTPGLFLVDRHGEEAGGVGHAAFVEAACRSRRRRRHERHHPGGPAEDPEHLLVGGVHRDVDRDGHSRRGPTREVDRVARDARDRVEHGAANVPVDGVRGQCKRVTVRA